MDRGQGVEVRAAAGKSRREGLPGRRAAWAVLRVIDRTLGPAAY
jgi:hypothetical protein